jgi:hydrogenase maturation protein HypF
MSTHNKGYKIHVDGIVQGVGFRPFVYNLARSLNLNGWVRNTSSGVDIVVVGNPANLEDFLHELKFNPPILARIDRITTLNADDLHPSDFLILESQPNEGDFIPVSPDVSICPDCQRELFDPTNRRYRYPFINCTNCGPRFSIIQDIPYDRPLTTMAGFHMCPDCDKEYKNPTDRRYHAQPTACADCGPSVRFTQTGNILKTGESAIQAARAALQAGKILAVKGLGGYHLACDAFNPQSLNILRERKLRSDKPFALMAFDIATVKKYTAMNTLEEELLTSPQHPIVLLEKLSPVSSLDHTAPGQCNLGFMLPYTPLHLLLLEPADGYPEVLVMTSGNLSEEPIAFRDEEADARLIGIADCFLGHDRPIHMRVDDSVTRIVNSKSYPLRRSRGYAPEPIRMARNLSHVLACGAELKNTFALSRDQYVFISHHIGDLENLETLESFESGITHYRKLFRLTPESVAVDLHPDYLSTRFGEQLAREASLPLFRVQHHHAHLAACLADNEFNRRESVIGIILDGTGYGSDGHIWGGEILTGNYSQFERRFHLQEALLPGGDSAIRNPSKIALAYLFTANLAWQSDLAPISHHSEMELSVLHRQLTQNINCIPTSSMGRLFDAVSSLLGVRHQVTYEGQAAIELENLLDPGVNALYQVKISDGIIHTLDLFPQIIADLHRGESIATISAKFHNSLAQVCLEVCSIIRTELDLSTVALSGGVWQNTTLLKKTMSKLESAGFEVLVHRRVPTNDGGIALGQLLIADHLMKN